MDDRVLEKMVTRSCRQVKSPAALALASLVLFCAAFIWVIMKKLLFTVTGSFHLPLLIVILTIALVPISLVIAILSSRYLGARLQGEEHSLLDIAQVQIRPTAMVFVYACVLCGVEILFAVIAAIWCGIESIPALGAVVYFFFSWIPTLFTIVMGLVAAAHALTILSLGVHLSQMRTFDNSALGKIIVSIWTVKWITRLKVVLIGLIPLCLFCLFSSPWVLKTLPLPVELCATVVRTLVLSVFAAPFLLFAIHMAVEADRYVSKDL
jgi:hypothetical protein